MHRSTNNQTGITRRQFLAVATLSAFACSGVCGMSALAGGLLVSRKLEQQRQETEIAIQTQNALTATLAAPPQPAIIPRESWNARSVSHNAANEGGFYSADNPYGWYLYQSNLADIYNTIVVHHSYPIPRDTGTMLDIQSLHQGTNRWADIGYHYGIDGRGTIYAGRDINARGTSVAGHNYGTIGIVLIGNFEEEVVAPEQLNSLQAFITWLAYTYTISHLAGHYEFNSNSVCPGRNARPYLDMLASNAGLQRGTGGYVRPPDIPPQSRLVESKCC